MILYLDTSALVKIFIREPGREIVAVALSESAQVATAMVSYAEARAVFARLLREDRLTDEEHSGIVAALNERWPLFEKPPVTENLIRLAGDVAQHYALRGYDAIQLASAIICRSDEPEFRFLAFDDHLTASAGQALAKFYGSGGQ